MKFETIDLTGYEMYLNHVKDINKKRAFELSKTIKFLKDIKTDREININLRHLLSEPYKRIVVDIPHTNKGKHYTFEIDPDYLCKSNYCVTEYLRTSPIKRISVNNIFDEVLKDLKAQIIKRLEQEK